MIQLNSTIKKLFYDLKITQKEFAKKIGVSPKYVSLVLNNKRIPNIEMLVKLTSAFNMTFDYLLWESIEIPKELTKEDYWICEKAKLIIRKHLKK